MENSIIIQKLESIESKLSEQNLLQKEVLNFTEACTYLELSESHLYKLTSTKQVPHFCPNGKKLYFKRVELEQWLLRNRVSTIAEIVETKTAELIAQKSKKS